jgi:hypothetical protein
MISLYSKTNATKSFISLMYFLLIYYSQTHYQLLVFDLFSLIELAAFRFIQDLSQYDQ